MWLKIKNVPAYENVALKSTPLESASAKKRELMKIDNSKVTTCKQKRRKN
jgi:hypothetical protein